MRPPEEHDACGVGFIADLSHTASHEIVRLALEAVGCMVHRGARGSDGRTGDGAGLLIETPRSLLIRELPPMSRRVPERHLAAIALFLPHDPEEATGLRGQIEAAVYATDVKPLLWRRPKVDPEVLGEHARATRPLYEQLLVDMGPGNVRERMRQVRRNIIRTLRDAGGGAALVSASPDSVIYKGLLSSNELGSYFKDLRDPAFTSRYAIFHQRFSTNTSPSWKLVQPFNLVAHNGEINTITGNRAWMRARGMQPIRGASDSLDFDTNLDEMLGAGHRIDVAIDFMLAPAIDPEDDRLHAYYDAHVPTIEPWDGPAAMIFTDGDIVGAALDRNGFRPMRWCRTESGKVLCASEAGVVDFGSDAIVQRGRLGPGERLVVRFATGELVQPKTFREERRARGDYRPIVRSWHLDLPSEALTAPPEPTNSELVRFAFAKDEIKDVVEVVAAGGGEPILSMGDDAALPFLERRMPVAYYLRQRFAQVTNPPIDPYREGLVFDMRAWIGSGPTNGDVPSFGSLVMLEHAVLDEHAFDLVRADERLLQHVVKLELGASRLGERLREIAHEAEEAVRHGASLIVLDDRDAHTPVPAVLAAGAVHQTLTSAGLRMQSSIAVADGFGRDSHSIAAVISAGANVVCPWLGLRIAAHHGGTSRAFLDGVRSGVLKVMSKLGICTLRSYIGAQTFETIGLGRDIVDLCFPGMRAHVPTIRMNELEEDIRAWSTAADAGGAPQDRGLFRYRREGIRRGFDPNVIKFLRAAAMNGDYAAYEKLSDEMEARPPIALRDLIAPQSIGDPIALEETQSAADIVRKFVTAAMSLGSLGPEAHATIATGVNAIGARSNSGEGGEDSSRFWGPSRSAIKQVASARFGVGAEYLASADELEIKMAQGSKPGEGGQIPGFKVSADIARIRGARPGQQLISPPPHHDIYSIEDLAQLIYDLRRAAPQARIAVKLVSQSGIGVVASGVAKARADVIHISGFDGGTGASPLSSIKHAGLPWELGLVETHHALVANGLRSRVKLRVDGGFKSGRDVIVAAMLGADMYGFGTALLIALGCIYARQCHKNTCPVGIASQDPKYREKFKGKPEDAIAFFEFIANDVRRRLAKLGARSLEEIHGRSDLLRVADAALDLGVDVDLTEVLRLPEQMVEPRDVPIEESHVDDRASARNERFVITPADRTIGARIAHSIVLQRKNGEDVRPTVLRYRGTAGQSFGAFITNGLTLELDGDANDFVGKGMEGGKIIVRSPGEPHEPAIGNACFYGARGGEAFVYGAAGERLAVRNSGATIVTEGAGDHACEYMTKGTVAILGPVGRNFASGMTGGTVFTLLADAPADLPHEDMSVMSARDSDAGLLRDLLERHHAATNSALARELVASWPESAQRFGKFAPGATVSEPVAAQSR
ncbi:MAG: glutamate synthase large subunit [Vulcanimicrobiaceae bacterium]|jgi:glutamate synthase domain-containing protein 2/glutamate synthase domain-containing protein 1/glutamate synthase domain-containing protein 3